MSWGGGASLPSPGTARGTEKAKGLGTGEQTYTTCEVLGGCSTPPRAHPSPRP